MKRTEVKTQTDDLQMPRAPCSRKTSRRPHACIIQTVLKRKKSVASHQDCKKIKANPSRTPVVVVFFGGADFDFFVDFEKTASCTQMLDDVLALAKTLSACLRCRTARTCFASLCMTDCAMLCSDRCSTTTCSSRSWVCFCVSSRKSRLKKQLVRTSYILLRTKKGVHKKSEEKMRLKNEKNKGQKSKHDRTKIET